MDSSQYPVVFLVGSIIPPYCLYKNLMISDSNGSLTKAEFDGWAGEIKSSFTSVEAKLDRHELILTEHTRRLVGIEEKLGDHTRQLTAIERTLREHTGILAEIAGTLKAIGHELHAHVRLYDRLDHRDHVFADQLHLDLKQIDAEV